MERWLIFYKTYLLKILGSILLRLDFIGVEIYKNIFVLGRFYMEKGRILYVTTVSRTVNAFLLPHIYKLIEEGYRVDIACYIDKDIDKELINKGVKVYNVPFKRNPFSLKNIKAFIDLIKMQKQNNYDIVHVHTPIASIYGRLLKIKFKNLKTIYTAHGYHFFKGGSKLAWAIYYPIEKLMAKLTDITININSEDYEITKEKLKPKNYYYMKGVGIDLSKYKRLTNEEIKREKISFNFKNNDFIIIMIAELNKNKNHMQLIKSLEILNKKYNNIKALCIGEGKKFNELDKEVKNRNLEDNIKFLGFREDINELINIADIGVLFSYREGLPKSILEVMANGKKVIATNIRGNRDLICNAKLGTLVKVNDYEETAKVIENYYIDKFRIINDYEDILREIKKYEVEKICEELIKIYDKLIES